MSIRQNIQSIKKTSGNAAIIAVTKNRSINEINEVINCGITNIGENRLQEAKGKFSELRQNATKHFIGRIQTNKIKDIVRLFDVVQSIDSIKAAKKIDLECVKINKVMPILIQINTSNEGQKGGIDINNTESFIKEASKLHNIKIEGLMTIAVNSNDEDMVKNCFKRLKILFDQIKQKNIPNVNMKWLSMGMSGDYKLALLEGANMLRIGTSIFK